MTTPWGARTLKVFLVLGPTGVGKTERAAELGQMTGAPIVVLDRVQCHRELSVGSGREAPDGPSDLDRRFLADRAVSEGVIAASTAFARLVRMLDDVHGEGYRAVILEGGSLSLLAEMAASSRWRSQAEVSIEHLRPNDKGHYEQRVRCRVENMLCEGHGGRTMVDEVRALWPDVRARSVLEGIVGYREILHAACRDGVDAFNFSGSALDRLAEEVTAAHLRYASTQIAQLPALTAQMRPPAETGHLQVYWTAQHLGGRHRRAG